MNEMNTRHKETVDLVENTLSKDCDVLDIGSKPYNVAHRLTDNGFNVTAVDKNYSGKKKGMTVVQCDIGEQRLPLPENSFDAALMTEVLEHLRVNPLHTLREINRVLTCGGTLLLSTPNFYSFYNIVYFLLGRGFMTQWDIVPVFQQLEEKGFPGHIRVYREEEITELLCTTGFTVEEVGYSNIGGRPGKLGVLARPVTRVFPRLKKNMFFKAAADRGGSLSRNTDGGYTEWN